MLDSDGHIRRESCQERFDEVCLAWCGYALQRIYVDMILESLSNSRM